MSCGGYCFNHRKDDPSFERKQKDRATKKEGSMLRAMGETKLVNNAGANEFQLQQNWYFDMGKELAKNPICAECGAWIPPAFYRAAIAHVLPKRKEYGFPSVARHPLNKMFLGAGCGCHKKYDDTWEGASQMKIWSTAIIIFVEIYPFIHPDEYKNIPDILRPYIAKL